MNIRAEEPVLRFDFSVRERFEAWNGMNARNYGDNSQNGIGNLNDRILLQRMVAGFTWKSSPKLTIGIHLQDSRALGWSLRQSRYPELFKVGTRDEFYIMNPQEEFLEIFDAFIEYGELLPGLNLKFGRQKIFLGDNRLAGPGEWGNTGRWTWDAFRFTYHQEAYSIDFFAGGTKVHNPFKVAIPFTETEFWGGGLYGRYFIKDKADLEPFFFYKTAGSAPYARDRDISRYWLGFRLLNRYLKQYPAEISIIKNFGQAEGRQVKAFAFHAKIGRNLPDFFLNPTFGTAISFASGGSQYDDVNRTFDFAFGASDRYYGRMNLFGWSNLDNRELFLELKPTDKLFVELKYHQFRIPHPEGYRLLANLQLLPGENRIGDEIDLFIRYNLNQRWELIWLAGIFFPGRVKPINDLPTRNATLMSFQVLFNL